MRTAPRPLFFLFLLLGPFVVIPYLMLFPVQITFAAAWRKSSGWLWRVLILVSVLVAIVITCPGSPWFQGLGSPSPLAAVSGFGSMEFFILRPQLMLINAAMIALFVCFPVALASSIDNWIYRKRRERRKRRKRRKR